MIQALLINLHPNEYSQEFHYYPFAAKLDRCVGSFNSLIELSNKVCIPNKTEDLNLNVLNMTTFIKELKTFGKNISWKCRCTIDWAKCKSTQLCNNNKYWSECKKHHICEKDYIWNPATCNCENGKYLASIMGDSTIMCDEVVES